MATLKESIKLGLVSEGDLLAVSRNSFFSRMIRLWTKETYSHVAIIYKIHGEEVTVAEAFEGKGVRLLSIKKLLPAHIFGIDGKITPNACTFINSKLGQKYSWFDCVRASVGWRPKKDDKWQCAEFANAVLRADGLAVDGRAITPGKLVREVLRKGSGRSIYISEINK